MGLFLGSRGQPGPDWRMEQLAGLPISSALVDHTYRMTHNRQLAVMVAAFTAALTVGTRRRTSTRLIGGVEGDQTPGHNRRRCARSAPCS